MSVSLIISIITQFIIVFSHDQLDLEIVNSRTCPYKSDMEQRISMFVEAVFWKSRQNSFVFGPPVPLFGQSFNDLLDNYIFADKAAIVFPQTIEDSSPHFLFPEANAGLIDFSKHYLWCGLDSILNGGAPGPQTCPPYGQDPQMPFQQILETLPFTVQIIPANSWFWCDEEKAWGFGYGTVFIREKKTGREYIGRAQLITTFANNNVEGVFDFDEWEMDEIGIFWDIYSGSGCDELSDSDSDELDDALAMKGNVDNSNNNENDIENDHIVRIELVMNNSLLLCIIVVFILLCIVAKSVLYCFECKRKSEVTFDEVP